MSPEHGLAHHDEVGVCLAAGAEADAVVEVVAGESVRISPRATYVRIESASGELVIRYADVAEVLGYPFGAGEFQAILSAYYGRPTLDDDQISFSSDMSAGVLDA